MSKTQEAKRALAIRREMRLRREKTAAMMMHALIVAQATATPDIPSTYALEKAIAVKAVVLADILLVELDRSAPKEIPV